MGANLQGLSRQLGLPQQFQVALGPAQLQTLAVAVPIIPAPGPGLSVIPYFFLFQFKFGSIVYTNGGTMNILSQDGNVGLSPVNAFGLITAAGNRIATISGTTGAGVLPASFENQAWMLKGGNNLNGDGTLVVTSSFFVAPSVV